MDEINKEYWQNELKCALEREGITDPNFFAFLKGKVRSYNVKVEDFNWAVFPRIDVNGVLTDISMVVPTVYDMKSLCVNIHEYTHAYELYFCLGEVYVWHVEESEAKAREAEHRLLLHYETNK